MIQNNIVLNFRTILSLGLLRMQNRRKLRMFCVLLLISILKSAEKYKEMDKEVENTHSQLSCKKNSENFKTYSAKSPILACDKGREDELLELDHLNLRTSGLTLEKRKTCENNQGVSKINNDEEQNFKYNVTSDTLMHSNTTEEYKKDLLKPDPSLSMVLGETARLFRKRRSTESTHDFLSSADFSNKEVNYHDEQILFTVNSDKFATTDQFSTNPSCLNDSVLVDPPLQNSPQRWRKDNEEPYDFDPGLSEFSKCGQNC